MWLVNNDGDEVSSKFFITHWVPISNLQLCGYEVIMTKIYDGTNEVIIFKIHSIQEMILEHKNLA